ncbi:hypothetical protein Tco_0177378, partial [Tanacetum coccineum]
MSPSKRKFRWGIMRSTGIKLILLNTINHLGKFDGKSDEGILVGYSLQSKAFRSLGRDKDGIEVLLLPNLFIFLLAQVSTDSAKLVPLGKVSTAIETLKKIPPRVQSVTCSLFDKIPEDTLDYMETEDAQDVGRSRDVVNEEKENVDAEVSTEDVISTAQQK